MNSDLTPKPISFASMWIAQYLAFGLSPQRDGFRPSGQIDQGCNALSGLPAHNRHRVSEGDQSARTCRGDGNAPVEAADRRLVVLFHTVPRSHRQAQRMQEARTNSLNTHRPRASYKLIRSNILVADHRQPRVAVGKRPSRDVPAERRAVRAGGMRLRVLPVRWSHVIG